jgi:hypothetical protein
VFDFFQPICSHVLTSRIWCGRSQNHYSHRFGNKWLLLHVLPWHPLYVLLATRPTWPIWHGVRTPSDLFAMMLLYASSRNLKQFKPQKFKNTLKVELCTDTSEYFLNHLRVYSVAKTFFNYITLPNTSVYSLQKTFLKHVYPELAFKNKSWVWSLLIPTQSAII